MVVSLSSLCSFILLCHKKNPNRGGSYIDSPDWIKAKKEQ